MIIGIDRRCESRVQRSFSLQIRVRLSRDRDEAMPFSRGRTIADNRPLPGAQSGTGSASTRMMGVSSYCHLPRWCP